MSPRRTAAARLAGRLLDGAVVLVAASLLLSTLAAALHDVSRAWDVWYYHMPFAARLGGVLSPADFAFHPANQARFEGFPLLGERLAGALWRLTGRAESANLVAWSAVPLLSAFMARRFGARASLAAVALLAVPLVQLHSTSCYVDLPAGAAACCLFLLTVDTWSRRAPPGRWTLLLAGLCAAIAADMRFQLHPVLLATLGALGWRTVPRLVRLARGRLRGPRRRARRTLALAALALPMVFAAPLDNLVEHGNPYYPVRLQVLGYTLPGTEAAYASAPTGLEDLPRPARFAASLLELGIRPLSSTRRWTIDQWKEEGSGGERMGGFFHAYVVALLLLFAARVARDPSPFARAAGAGFALLTALVSVLPQSHELRYYLVWMLALVTLSVVVACRPCASRAAVGPRGLAVVALSALAVVLWVTGLGYAYPSGSTFRQLVDEQVDARVLAGVRDGERVCVSREPYSILWAAPFHAPLRYEVVSAESPADCGAARPLGE